MNTIPVFISSSTCPCQAMAALKAKVAHLEEQTAADSAAMHTLHEKCLEARKEMREAELKCKCYERGLLP